MKRAIIIVTASLVAGKAAKEITIFIQAKGNLESYFLWKQVEHAERGMRRDDRRRRREGIQWSPHLRPCDSTWPYHPIRD